MPAAEIHFLQLRIISPALYQVWDWRTAQATGAVFGSEPYVVALKSYMGHTMAACGAIETVLTLYMMQEGFIAPTLNLGDIDERCAMIRHVQKLIEHPVKTAAIQNFAFGGVNTSLLIRKVT